MVQENHLCLRFFDSGMDTGLSPEKQAVLSGPHNYWIDATELCYTLSGGKKQFRDYVDSKVTDNYLAAMCEVPFKEGGMPGGPKDRTHILRMGNTGFGHHAWICPRLLIDLVRWLSPTISVRLNHMMFELLSGRMDYSCDLRAAKMQVIIARVY